MNAPRAHKMRTIARLSGFSPALLRAWERRHGLLEPQRTEGGQRLYTDDDLRVLARVRQLLDEGRSIGEVALMGRPALLAQAAVPLAPERAPSADQVQRLRRAIVEGTVEVDAARVGRALDETLSLVSPETALSRVIEPALEEIGQLWSQGRCSVAGEHLTSTLIEARLMKLLEASNPLPGNGAVQAICACLPDEQHRLGALTVAYWLARHGRRVTYLGADLPLEDLDRAVGLLAPREVWLSVSREPLLQAHLPRLVQLVERHRGATVFHVGGRAVQREQPELARAGARAEMVSDFATLLERSPELPGAGRPRRRK